MFISATSKLQCYCANMNMMQSKKTKQKTNNCFLLLWISELCYLIAKQNDGSRQPERQLCFPER